MVRGDTADTRREAFDDISVKEGPGGVAVEHDNGDVGGAFVDNMHVGVGIGNGEFYEAIGVG